MSTFSPQIRAYLRQHLVGHLATVDDSGQPYIVPVCFALDGGCLYSVIDHKPKRVAPRQLKRLRNIAKNPQVAFIVDDYSEDWSRLGYVLVIAKAEVILEGQEHDLALSLLQDKYPQYKDMSLSDSPIIRLTPQRTVEWRSTPS